MKVQQAKLRDIGIRLVPAVALLLLFITLIAFAILNDDTPAPDEVTPPSVPSFGLPQIIYRLEAEAARSGWTPTMHREIGDAHYAMGDYVLAAAHWESAGDDPALLRDLAGVYSGLQRWSAALDTLRELHAHAPEDAWTNYHLGVIVAPFDPTAAFVHLEAVRDIPVYAHVARSLLDVLAAHAGDPLVSMHIGLALFEAEQWAFAELAFDHAADIAYPFPDAIAYGALARVRQGKDGSESIAQAVELGHNSAQVRYIQALYLREENAYAASLEAMLQAVVLEPDNPAFMAELGTAYRLTGEAVLAEQWLRQAVDASGNAPHFQRLLALFYAEEGYNLSDEGARVLARASDDLPDDPDIRASYGWALHTLGFTEQALAEIEAALALQPGNARALYYRGRIAIDEGDLTLARDLLAEVAASISPFAVEARHLLDDLNAS